MKRFALPAETRRVLQPFFPDYDLQRVRVRLGIPRYVTMTAGEPLGYADRDTIYLQPAAYQPATIDGLALLAHEIAHCRQYDQRGVWRFRQEYLQSYWRLRRTGLGHAEAYLKIPFEIEARAIEELVFETLHQQQVLAPELLIVNTGSIKLYEQGIGHQTTETTPDQSVA